MHGDLKLLLKYLLNHRGLREEHARRLFFHAARRFTPSVLAAAGPVRYHVSTRDRVIGLELFLHGAFEPDQQERVFTLLRTLGWEDFSGRTFLDVGANVGSACLPAVLQRGFSRAVALEPDPANFRLLEQNVLANDVGERVRALNLALSDRAGELSLSLDPDSHGNHFIRTRPAGAAGEIGTLHGEGRGGTVSIRAVTLDRLMEDGEVRPEELGLAWMDTQGHEGHILAGARRLLESGVPVLAEYWPYGLRRAGGLETFEERVAAGYTHFLDVRTADPADPRPRPAAEISKLNDEYPATAFTDVLLLRLG